MKVLLHNVIIVFSSCVLFLSIINCESKKTTNSHLEESETVVGKGALLAKEHCSGCHLFPSPDLLDIPTWKESVLPQMALHFGLFYNGKTYEAPIPRQVWEDSEVSRYAKEIGLYPELPTIPLEDWELIVDYYAKHAPEMLPFPKRIKEGSNSNYSFEGLNLGFGDGYSSFSFISIDAEKELIYLGDARSSSLYMLDYGFDLIKTIPTNSCPVKVMIEKEDLYILTMGSFEAGVQQKGELLLYREGEIQMILEGLNRPVDFSLTNFKPDSPQEFLIAEFGSLTGGLNLYYEQQGEMVKESLYAGAGVGKIEIKDFSNDGNLDILCLIAHGEEGLAVFYHKEGQFVQDWVLKFPPVYGSTFFEFVNLSGDGQEALIFVNGDNADLSPILKPYHGVRIFEKKEENWVERDFFPIPGAYKILCDDFTSNGLNDLAVVSFFPDFQRSPREGFLMLEQVKKGEFEKVSVAGTESGRWIDLMVFPGKEKSNPQILLAPNLISQGPIVPMSLRQKWMKENLSLGKIILSSQ